MDNNKTLDRILDKLDSLSGDLGEVKEALAELRERSITQADSNRKFTAHMEQANSHINNVRGAGKLLALIVSMLSIAALVTGLIR